LTASYKVHYLRLRAISQNFTYAKYAAFFKIAQALILNFLKSRQIATFYECIKDWNHGPSAAGGRAENES